MNVKKAKKLRKRLGYKPKDERAYGPQVIVSYLGKVREIKSTAQLTEKCSRRSYKEAKKESIGA